MQQCEFPQNCTCTWVRQRNKGELADSCSRQWSNCGGTAFPFRFWRGNAVPSCVPRPLWAWTRGNVAYPRVHSIISYV